MWDLISEENEIGTEDSRLYGLGGFNRKIYNKEEREKDD